MVDDTQFIDADDDYANDKNTFEDIVNLQIKKTADALSKELKSHVVNSKTGLIEDNRQIAINHVETLKNLIYPFLEKDTPEKIEKIYEEIKQFMISEGEKETTSFGVGVVKVKQLMHDEKSIYWKKSMEFKIEKYREMFGLLMQSYVKRKNEIASLGRE